MNLLIYLLVTTIQHHTITGTSDYMYMCLAELARCGDLQRSMTISNLFIQRSCILQASVLISPSSAEYSSRPMHQGGQ